MVKTKVVSVPIDLLRPVVCVRRDVGDLTALVDSIREYGLLQPLLVSENDDGTFGIIWGYRRYLAALEAGLRELPVISLGKVSLEKALELILKEDVLRLQLKRDERCLTLAALAMSWGVRKTARILKIPRWPKAIKLKNHRLKAISRLMRYEKPIMGKLHRKMRFTVRRKRCGSCGAAAVPPAPSRQMDHHSARAGHSSDRAMLRCPPAGSGCALAAP